jgi:hypothetical protein
MVDRSIEQKPCAACFMWRLALAVVAIVLLVSWLTTKQ